MRKKILALVAIVLLPLVLSACLDEDKNKTKKSAGKAAQTEQQSIATGFERLTKSQQIPSFDYSQERQTLLDVLTVRAEGTHGTAVATTLDGELLWWCPTQGAPVPSTYQVTPTKQWVDLPGHGETLYDLDQGEPTGVYVGDSAATWTVCLDDNGTPFGKYEEQNVGWTSGVVNGLPPAKRARVDEITFEFTTQD